MTLPTHKPWNGLNLAQLISKGYTTSEIAEIAETSGCAVRTAVARRGMRSNLPKLKTVRDRAEEMKPLDAANYLLQVLEDWFPVLTGDVHEIDSWGMKLTPTPRLLLAALVDACPRPLSRPQIMACIYATRDERDWPKNASVLDIFVRQIRNQLPADRGEVLTVHGRGFIFERAGE